jgi:hypothetical protein
MKAREVTYAIEGSQMPYLLVATCEFSRQLRDDLVR